MDGRVYTHGHTDIGRASQYEYAGQKPGIRISAAIAEAPWRGAIGFYAVLCAVPVQRFSSLGKEKEREPPGGGDG